MTVTARSKGAYGMKGATPLPVEGAQWRGHSGGGTGAGKGEGLTPHQVNEYAEPNVTTEAHVTVGWVERRYLAHMFLEENRNVM